MKLNLPNPGLHWVKESPIDWSLMTKGENPVEMSRISKEDNEWEWINETVYFKSDCIKDWVKGALNQRESKIRQKKLEKEKQKNLKVLKEL